MTRSFAFALSTLLTIPCFAADAIKAPAESDDIKSIFNGKDLTGWDGDSRLWSVKDGVIHGETTDTVKANGNTFLIWKDGRLKDFELRLSFRCTATNNSGIQYRSKHITDRKVRNEWVVRGYQHEIRNENTLPSVSGFIYDEGGLTGGVFGVQCSGHDPLQAVVSRVHPEQFTTAWPPALRDRLSHRREWRRTRGGMPRVRRRPVRQWTLPLPPSVSKGSPWLSSASIRLISSEEISSGLTPSRARGTVMGVGSPDAESPGLTQVRQGRPSR